MGTKNKQKTSKEGKNPSTNKSAEDNDWQGNKYFILSV